MIPRATVQADLIAVLFAALERYAAEEVAEQAAFRSGAERGRPPAPSGDGVSVVLGRSGALTSLTVHRCGPDLFQVVGDRGAAEVRWTRLPGRDRILETAGGKHLGHVRLTETATSVRIDQGRWSFERGDGTAVRAGFPAFVSEVLVRPGDRVQAGQAVAVVEAMKMESRLYADRDATVAEVLVLPNSQVNVGAPIVRLNDLATGSAAPASTLDLTTLSLARESAVATLRNYLMGYDRSPQSVAALIRAVVTGNEPADPATEDDLIDLFADTAALVSPVSAHETDLGPISAGEYLTLWLQSLDPDRAGLPTHYRSRLSRVLARHGVPSLDSGDGLAEAGRRISCGTTRLTQLSPVIEAVLGRRSADAEAVVQTPGEEELRRLDRLIGLGPSIPEPVAEAARDLRFRLVDEPELRRGRDAALARAQSILDELAADPGSDQRGQLFEEIVAVPYSVTDLLTKMRASDDRVSTQQMLLQVRALRRYRDQVQGGLTFAEHDGVALARLRAVSPDADRELALACLPVGDLHRVPALLAEVRDGRAGNDSDLELDLLVYPVGGTEDEQTQAAVAEAVSAWSSGLGISGGLVTAVGAERPHIQLRRHEDRVVVGTASEIDPMLAARLELWRLREFDLTRLPAPAGVHLFHGKARADEGDHRLFALAEVRDLRSRPDTVADGQLYPDLERVGIAAVAAMRAALAGFDARSRPRANQLNIVVRPMLDIPRDQWSTLANRLQPLAPGAGLDCVVLRVTLPDVDGGQRDAVLRVEGLHGGGVTVRQEAVTSEPIKPLTPYRRKVLTARRFGVWYPWEILRVLAANGDTVGELDPGAFVEYDLDVDGHFGPVSRRRGENTANVVVGLITSYTDRVPEGMTRVAILSDPTHGMGTLAEPECRRIDAALDLAEQLGVPVEWFAVSSGALISTDSGTENMDWIAGTLRRIIEFTQAGGELNVVVTGINVGGQAYWNAEATMLMHTRGILIQVAGSAMVLTGKQALDYSGGVSASDNLGIGGYERIMGVNGQAQYRAESVLDACRQLLTHYAYTYVVPGERFPRPMPTTDPVSRDVGKSPHADVAGTSFRTVGEIFSAEHNPARKSPFDIRSVMQALVDSDSEPLERWHRWAGAENAVVWEAAVGGLPLSLIGIESHPLPRRGSIPADGPETWTAGTLFPQASRKVARAINAVAGRRPVVVLANLSGFDGSPESLRSWQLEYGSEIGRAVVNFDGPMVLVVVSRYHGGAFVVFSKALNPRLEVAAVAGSYASVIGGAPAAATVFAREVRRRVGADAHAANGGSGVVGPEALAALRSEHLGRAAVEFDAVHTIDRALQVGSIDQVIEGQSLRPYVVDAVTRGMRDSSG